MTTRSQGDHRRWTTAAVAGILVALVGALAFWIAVFVVFNTPVDFYVYYMAGHHLAAGESPYTVSDAEWHQTAADLRITHFTEPYRYPPHTAVVGRLLGPLGPRGALVAWEVGSALSFVGGAALVALALGGGWRRYALAWGATLLYGPVYMTLMDGQVNGFAFLFLALAFWGVRRRRDGAAGTGVAVAAALKLTPLVLVGLYLWRRAWRAALVAVAVLAALTLLCWPLAGTTTFVEYGTNAYRLTDPQRVNISPYNQSFTGVAGRLLLKQTTWSTTGRAAAVHWLALVFALALTVTTAVALWPRRASAPAQARAPGGGPDSPPPSGSVESFAFAAALSATLVVGTFTYYPQFSWLLIPLLLVADRLLGDRRWRLLGLLAALVLLVDLNESLWLLIRDRATFLPIDIWRMFDLPFVFAMVLWAACAGTVWRAAPAAPPATAPDVSGAAA